MARVSVFRGVIIPCVLTLIPGWGHIWIHRSTRGLLLFVVTAGALNTALVGQWIEKDLISPMWVRLALALGGAAIVFAFADILRLTLWSRSKSVQDKRRQLLRRAVLHWIRAEHGQAEEVISRVLRIDPTDPAALVWSATIHREIGNKASAGRALSRAASVDRDGEWDYEIQLEQQDLRTHP